MSVSRGQKEYDNQMYTVVYSFSIHRRRKVARGCCLESSECRARTAKGKKEAAKLIDGTLQKPPRTVVSSRGLRRTRIGYSCELPGRIHHKPPTLLVGSHTAVELMLGDVFSPDENDEISHRIEGHLPPKRPTRSTQPPPQRVVRCQRNA